MPPEQGIDVNKRLMRILETTYNIHDTKTKVSEDISRAIKSMAANIRFQEERLQQNPRRPLPQRLKRKNNSVPVFQIVSGRSITPGKGVTFILQH
jgi:hypothetical protein